MTDSADCADMACTLMRARQTILPKRLTAPGPDPAQLERILGAAASAPDHGQVLPWRLIEVPANVRSLLAEQFAIALQQRDGAARPEQLAQAREKAFRAPCLFLLVVDAARGDADIDFAERLLCAGAAVQNVLLMATALGFGSALTSGKALKAEGLRRLFALTQADHALCFVSLGSAQSRKAGRQHPSTSQYLSHLTPAQGVAAGLAPLDRQSP